MLRSQFYIAENVRLYALIERYPWILNTPPVPPGLGPGVIVPVEGTNGDPVVFRP
ncbi:MAG: hypothetical protein ACRDJE_12570 [Dehalococcoidia bacterium]